TIISITFLAIGFANGALNYLQKKINDPFVNWFTIKLPGPKSSSAVVNNILDTLNSDEIKNNYLIKSATKYKETPLFFFPANKNVSEYSKGRLMSVDDPIGLDLFNEDNRISGDTNFNCERDMGIVITRKLLERLGYSKDAKIIYFDNNDKNISKALSENYKVPIPIRAVIKSIPNRNNFIITNFFHDSYMTDRLCIFDFKEQSKSIIIYTGENKESAKLLSEEIKRNLKNLTPEFTTDDLTIDIDKCEEIIGRGFAVSVSFNTRPEEAEVAENLYEKITTLPYYVKNKGKFFRVFNYNIAPEQPDNTIYDYLSINFKNLDKIEDFSKYINISLNEGDIKDENNMIDVDAGAVKEKKNFNYISKMTWLIAALLTVFSILAISLFISNLLKTHLHKVKMNIGTYKAFGLSDKESKNIYLQIMMRFIILGLAISFATAFLLGKFIGLMFETSLNIDDKPEYFRLFDVQTFVLLGIIILVTIFVSYFNINKILSKTPGDLIYNR
ncbi:MAG TPA: ABC transporter permease, partial [Bacteroidia bacterium]|nr:ABC transporter permease [Bacteroidia bacterium]